MVWTVLCRHVLLYRLKCSDLGGYHCFPTEQHGYKEEVCINHDSMFEVTTLKSFGC